MEPSSKSNRVLFDSKWVFGRGSRDALLPILLTSLTAVLTKRLIHHFSWEGRLVAQIDRALFPAMGLISVGLLGYSILPKYLRERAICSFDPDTFTPATAFKFDLRDKLDLFTFGKIVASASEEPPEGNKERELIRANCLAFDYFLRCQGVRDLKELTCSREELIHFWKWDWGFGDGPIRVSQIAIAGHLLDRERDIVARKTECAMKLIADVCLDLTFCDKVFFTRKEVKEALQLLRSGNTGKVDNFDFPIYNEIKDPSCLPFKELSDSEWYLLSPYLPAWTPEGFLISLFSGELENARHLRKIMNTIFYVEVTKCSWDGIPKGNCFASSADALKYFGTLKERGDWERIKAVAANWARFADRMGWRRDGFAIYPQTT